MKRVGILALQGDFAAHEAALVRAGGEPVLVRNASQFKEINGLIIPGGESTTMLKLLHYDNLMEPLKAFAREKPIFGTCAGAILLAKEVSHPGQESLAAIDMTIERNAYGRQIDSCIATIDTEPELRACTGHDKLEVVFIRGPIIRRTGPGVKVLARFKGDPILVEQGLHMAATFHPEMTTSACIHKLFLARLG